MIPAIFAITMLIACTLSYLGGFLAGAHTDTPIKQPTVKCTDGKLYDVSYESNITIYDKRPFTTCEEM